MEYTILEGKRKNSKLLYTISEKQLYRRKSLYKDQTYYMCYHDNCKCRIVLKNDICVKCDNFTEHDHDDQQELYEKLIPLNNDEYSKKKSIKFERPISDDAMSANVIGDSKSTSALDDINISMDLPSTSVVTAHQKAPMRIKLHKPATVRTLRTLKKSHSISGALKKPSSIEENEYDYFGKMIACQLKSLPESVAQQSMIFMQTHLMKQRFNSDDIQFVASFANESDTDDPLH